MNPLTQIKNTQKISAQEASSKPSSVKNSRMQRVSFCLPFQNVQFRTSHDGAILRAFIHKHATLHTGLQILHGVSDSASWHARFKHSACAAFVIKFLSWSVL